MEAEEQVMPEAIQEKGAEATIPRGVGPLTFEVLRREVRDWSRFTNRRHVSSGTGLCPREHSSGGKRRGGSVSKKGKPRVGVLLVEMVWRMMRWQPDDQGLKKWLPVVAIARQLAVELWRLFTEQTTGEKLGLIYQPEAA
jgi:transposase